MVVRHMLLPTLDLGLIAERHGAKYFRVGELVAMINVARNDC